MIYEQLKSLIEGQTENPSLDFKADCSLNLRKLAKDIIAMSDVRDGGLIVMGVKERNTGFEATGVSEANLTTYNKDQMKDKLMKYADPPVDFDLHFPSDGNGKTFVVIKVHPFKEIPMICVRDWDKDLVANTIYYRNTNQRVQSAAISNAHDLRAVIEHAAIKMFQKYRDLGLTQSSVINTRSELDLPNAELITKIKSKGFIEFKFAFSKILELHLVELKEIIRRCQVNFNWTYPYIHPRLLLENNSLQFGDDYLEMELDMWARKEFWRFFTNGSFSFFSAYTEDWFGEEGDMFRNGMEERYPSGEYLFYFTTILEPITAFISFLERVIIEKNIEGNIRVELRYCKTKDRKLNLDSYERLWTLDTKTTKADNISESINLPATQLKMDSLKISNELVIKVLKRFDFHPPADNILMEQKKILNNHN
ncbi:AlbA family DNA-binding domain-containing protein [Sphingobacterium chungjuense]|uniref:AlbA family DNA-binding domain-containing protein n=1 Tax=Sphingobacterium chungjuense TaxID=2675553 RepID=UPI0014090492|nr:ATP-binding protein [Sphingobacterium chungjuense]